MKATELRRGNLVFEEFNNIAKIQSIEYDEISEDMLIYYNKYIDCCFIKDDCKPIPLTEEWYIKFGYECMQELIADMIHNAIHPISNNIALWGVTISGLKVHELQNLYFALTSKELMI